MTTYRKDVRKEHALLTNSDTLSLFQDEVRGYLHNTHSRTNCLVGFTVISLLIGSAALVISTLLLLQSFEIVQMEHVKYEQLAMRIKYLEHLTESLEQTERRLKDPPPPPEPSHTPPQPPQLSPEPPSPEPPQLPIPPQPPIQPQPEPAPTPIIKEINPKKPFLPPIDDEERAEEDFEGSGLGCPVNPPRPICPIRMRICETRERCPSYVCCKG